MNEQYYSIRYPDMLRRKKGYPQASYFMIYRLSDDQAVFESSTHDTFIACDQAAEEVTAEYNRAEPVL